MPSVRLEDLTPFGRLALKLDQEFAELARGGEQLARLDLESDRGLDEGIRILNRVAGYGQALAQTMQDFSKSMQEARDKADAAARIVAERAQLIQQRRQREDELQKKLAQIQEDVKTVGAGLTGFGKLKGELSEDDKRRIAAELERLQEPMTRFIAAIKALKEEAAGLKFKRLERQAESMIDSLEASRRKIAQAIAPK